MANRLALLLDKIKVLEDEFLEELQKQEQEFSYEIHKRKVYFEANAILQQKEFVKRLRDYLKDAPIKHMLSVPFIWACLIPALFLDVTVTGYQWACFPLYGIPKVQRQDYIIFDRQYLNYLNLLEKINCAYCSYVNGLLAYVQEIAGRTEQFWCPIKHARHIKSFHSRYHKFINYADAQTYRSDIEKIRRDFNDLP